MEKKRKTANNVNRNDLASNFSILKSKKAQIGSFITISIFVGILIGSVVIGVIMYFISIDHSKNLDIPSQCYSTLQPSSFFTKNIHFSPITLDDIKVNYDSSYSLIMIPISDTGSMRPTLRDGSIVIIIKPSKEDLEVGDIVSYKCNTREGETLHRIIKINETGYLTKGDNNAVDDIEGLGCFPSFNNITKKVVGVLY